MGNGGAAGAVAHFGLLSRICFAARVSFGRLSREAGRNTPPAPHEAAATQKLLDSMLDWPRLASGFMDGGRRACPGEIYAAEIPLWIL